MSAAADIATASPELRVLLNLFGASSRRDPSSIFRTAAGRAPDWHKLEALAQRHLLYNQLAAAADAFGHGDCPEDFIGRLRDGWRQRSLVNRVLEARLVELSHAFADAGIPLVAFKGPALDQLLYGGTYLRQYADLDVYVPRNHVAASVELLRSVGFIPQVDTSDPVRHWALAVDGELTLSSQLPAGGMATDLDLHWRLLSADQPACTSLDGFEARLQQVDLAGTAVQTLDDTDLWLYLCHHASRHACCSILAHLFEIAITAQRVPAADFDKLLQAARADGTERSLLLGPYLAHTLLGADMPPALFARADQLPAMPEIRRRVLDAMDLSDLPRDTYRSVQAALWPRWSDRCRRTMHAVFTPRVADYAALPLGQPWTFLYFGLRPVRLLCREIVSFSQRGVSDGNHPS